MNYLVSPPPGHFPAPYFWTFFPLIILLVIIDVVLKLIASWHAARSGDKVWFVVLLIINTAGLLPLIYLLFFRKK